MNLAIGITGMVFILVAFILDEFVKNFNQNTVQYNILNIVGSALLAWYAFAIDSVPFLILNSVWFLAATVKLIKITTKK